MLYSILLPIHSILRWVVLAAAAFAIVRALIGWLGKKEWTRLDRIAGSLFTISVDVQILIGLLLYFGGSPVISSALQNFSGAMQNPTARFFAVEHIALMIFALLIAHVGRVLTKSASTDTARHRWAALSIILALIVILAGIPWPFSAAARPLLPF